MGFFLIGSEIKTSQYDVKISLFHNFLYLSSVYHSHGCQTKLCSIKTKKISHLSKLERRFYSPAHLISTSSRRDTWRLQPQINQRARKTIKNKKKPGFSWLPRKPASQSPPHNQGCTVPHMHRARGFDNQSHFINCRENSGQTLWRVWEAFKGRFHPKLKRQCFLLRHQGRKKKRTRKRIQRCRPRSIDQFKG